MAQEPERVNSSCPEASSGKNLQASARNELNRKLRLGRIDLWITEPAHRLPPGAAGGVRIRKTLHSAGHSELSSQSYYMAFGAQTPDATVEWFRKALETLKRNGSLTIAAQWQSRHLAQWLPAARQCASVPGLAPGGATLVFCSPVHPGSVMALTWFAWNAGLPAWDADLKNRSNKSMATSRPRPSWGAGSGGIEDLCAEGVASVGKL